VAFILDKGNGVQCIQKLNGSVLGWYRPSPSGGRTTDPNGRVIAQGNLLDRWLPIYCKRAGCYFVVIFFNYNWFNNL
jgi:hypothetical protein